MNYEQAWQSVLGQLQMEMPKATFDAWVRDTRALSCEDSILVIGVRDIYARDWLDSRLTSTINRLLIGILNDSSIRVNFVVAQNDNDSIDVETATGQTENPKNDEEQHDDTVEISPEAYDSAYEQIVRPDRAVYLPGYFRRWLRITGTDLGWMYIAFRQAAYVAGARKGNTSNRFSGETLAKLAGIAKRTYWNRLSNPATWKNLKGLVKIIDAGPEWDTGSATPKRLPRRYTVAMTLPLTPADATSLRKWIVGNMEKLGGAEATLRVAIDTPLEQLIPANVEVKDTDEPVTVRKLVRDMFLDELNENLLDSLASAMQTHIMPSNDLIVIPLFFLEHVLPHLGAGPAWMLTLLRDMCWIDHETGESRTQVTVPGGYAEIAGWFGMSRPLTIYEWLHGKKDGLFREAGLRMYLREAVKEKELGFETSERTLDVLIEDIPHQLLELALTGQDLGAIFSMERRHLYASCTIGFTQLAHDNYASCTLAFTRLAHDLYASCTGVLNSLTLLKPSSLNLKTTTRELDKFKRPAQTEETAAVAPVFWDLSELFRINNVHPKTQKKLREVGATSQAFVAHLLHAFSKQNDSIKKPLNFALGQLQESPDSGPDERSSALAALPPRVLIGMVAGESFDNPLASTWQKVMGNEPIMGTPRYRELLSILLGDAMPEQDE